MKIMLILNYAIAVASWSLSWYCFMKQRTWKHNFKEIDRALKNHKEGIDLVNDSIVVLHRRIQEGWK